MSWVSIAVATLGACAPPAQSGAYPTLETSAGPDAIGPVDRDSHHAILDQEDRCRFIDDCADGFFMDDDGCPDVEIAFIAGTARLDAGTADMVDAIGDEIAGDRLIALMRVTGFSNVDEPPVAVQRAIMVRDRLIARGVPPGVMLVSGVLTAPGTPGVVAFDVVSCYPP